MKRTVKQNELNAVVEQTNLQNSTPLYIRTIKYAYNKEIKAHGRSHGGLGDWGTWVDCYKGQPTPGLSIE